MFLLGPPLNLDLFKLILQFLVSLFKHMLVILTVNDVQHLDDNALLFLELLDVLLDVPLGLKFDLYQLQTVLSVLGLSLVLDELQTVVCLVYFYLFILKFFYLVFQIILLHVKFIGFNVDQLAEVVLKVIEHHSCPGVRHSISPICCG